MFVTTIKNWLPTAKLIFIEKFEMFHLNPPSWCTDLSGIVVVVFIEESLSSFNVWLHLSASLDSQYLDVYILEKMYETPKIK